MKAKKTSAGSKLKSTKPATAAKTAAAKSRTAAAKKPAAAESEPEIPAFLLEGDQPSAPAPSGPGRKFALGPETRQSVLESETELPAAYGTQRLFLTARDPHWLYAHWDLTAEQQARYNSLSTDKHLVLRILGADRRSVVTEIHVHPESRSWFAHVDQAGAKYFAELGYYEKRRKSWSRIAGSGGTITPPDSMADESPIEFSTIPVEVPFTKLVAMVKEAAAENLPLAQALEELRKSSHPQLPARAQIPSSEWTPAQQLALAEVISMDQVRRVWIGSLEITELLRRRLEREISSLGVSEFGFPTSPGGAISSVTSFSSPFGAVGERPPGAKGFWFNVNAELIIYGATEPDATVTIGGRKIKLRKDGSFSYRFSLPDGRYDLPAVAVSADQTDGRAAELRFSRSTEFRGEVGVHPQDPSLRPPTPDNV